MASLVKRISTSSLQSSQTSLLKGANSKMSSNEVWSFLISWSAVRHFGFWRGSLGFTAYCAFSWNSFLGHLVATMGNLGLDDGGRVPDVETVSALTWGTGGSGTGIS